MAGMSAIITIIVCTYLAGALATLGGVSARSAGETPVKTMFFAAAFSWLAFGYIACGGKLEAEEPSSPTETIRLSGSTGGDDSPWKV